MSPLSKIKQTTSLLVIFKKKKWMSFSNRNYSRTQYHYLLQRDMYRRVQGFSQSPFTYTWRCRFRDAKNTVDTNANLLKVSRLFSINRRGRGWKEWREYRNRKLLGFEKFKRRCCKKKKALFLLEPLSKSLRRNGESRILSWALKLKKSDATLRFFEKRNYHRG